MRHNTVDIITLGCSKNLVDSEQLMARLRALGYRVTHDSPHPQGEIAVINTCGFIGDAKEESVNMILEFCQAKEEGRLRRLYVMGCLSERYMKELGKEIPQVDRFYGKFDWDGIVRELSSSQTPKENVKIKELNNVSSLGEGLGYERVLTTPRHYAYVKISEGCDRKCAYCAIPIITGRHHSRPFDDIIAEVEYLVAQGVREFQVIAQELTYYGIDLYKKRMIAPLIDRMAQVKGVKWIRLHYAYPHQFPMELLDVMRRHRNVCRYLDIALQHISTNVLTNMRRHVDKEQTYELITRLREAVPGIHLRTTLMVGFPGEGEQEFEELKEFVRWARFERMGAFAYSEEDGTYAARHFKDEIPDDVKQERLSQLMAIQQDISAEVQAAKVGQTLKVIIDRKEGEYYVGRTEFDSPEVDPEVLIPVSAGRLRRGCFYQVTITDADDFDLYGKVKVIG
ncbi:MAG: 30S ribosomal protein S12 methylthiotransferase RimO [Bacteroidaceae bacterium]|nr:30S ribosomal protein S12 methylthiotransferase RimO [Bacteroidaceae bacterium]